MKKIFLFTLTTLILYSSKSQILTLDNLISLQQKELDDVESLLLKRNWEFQSSKIEDDTTYAIAAFKTMSSLKSNLEILQYLYSSTDKFKRIWYTCFNVKNYSSLLNRCRSLGFN